MSTKTRHIILILFTIILIIASIFFISIVNSNIVSSLLQTPLTAVLFWKVYIIKKSWIDISKATKQQMKQT